MVSYKEIQASNAPINDNTIPRIAVFAGGTSGIGKITIKALVATKNSIRIYLIGRKSSEERTKPFIQDLNAINPHAEIVWIEGEISLLADIKRVCDVVKERESRVDLLFLTAGYAPFSGREETTEGVEIAGSLEYYSRILLILHLLPLLNNADNGRVVSVLAGGLEKASLDLDDLSLKKPGNWSGVKAHMQYWGMKTTSMEKLAMDNPNVTFIHSWPGWVNTGNIKRSFPDANSIMGWLVWLVFEPIIGLFSFSDDESGQRHLFQCTSAAFGGKGVHWTGKEGVNTTGQQEGGLFLVNYKCDCTPNAKNVSLLREKAQMRVWEHTLVVLGPYL